MSYTADAITTLSGLEAIRTRPGMYIGSDGFVGLHHLAKEVISNALDEAMAGHGDCIQITIAPDGAMCVVDKGRGIPVEWKPENGMSALTAVMTSFHTGGKFSDNAYSSSGGLNGIGTKAVNAMSQWTHVEVRRYGLVFRQSFQNGGEYDRGVCVFNPDNIQKPVAEITAETSFEINKHGLATAVIQKGKRIATRPNAQTGTGTTLSFLPHREWFDAANMDWNGHVPWNYDQIATLCQQLAYLNPATTIELTDQRGGKTKTAVYHYPNGLIDYVRMLNEDLEAAHTVLHFTGQDGAYTVEVALQYTLDGEESQIYSYVNGIPTRNGGTHVSGFQSGLTKAMNALGATKEKIRGDDLLLGLAAVIKLVMRGTPQFSSQTKDTLTTPEVQGVVMSTTYTELTRLLEKHKAAVKVILKQAQAAAKGREVAKKARQLTIRKSVLDAPDDAGILSKLADTDKNTPPERRILFLVEGDSAGGTCNMARDRKIHAILASRGKIINAGKKDMARVLENNEIKAFVAALGAGFGADFSVADRRYGRVAILSDADVDGHHIRSLWLAFFWQYMRPLLEHGYLHVAEAPLYRVYNSKEEIYCYTDKERDAAFARLGDGAHLQRFKGLGEMSAEQMRVTTLAPGRERLVQVNIDDLHRSAKAVHLLMSDTNASARKEWLLTTWGE